MLSFLPSLTFSSMNTVSDKVKSYYRYHALIYDATRWLFLFNRKKAIEKLSIQPSDTVLDFGCGTGLNFKYIMQRSKNLTGIDFSNDMLDKAKKKFPGVRLVETDIVSGKIGITADKIICTYALSLIDDYENAVINMKNHLRSSGMLVLLDFSKLYGALKFAYPLLDWWLKHHKVNAEIPYEKILKKYFRNVNVETFHSGYNVIATASYPLE
ncbi:MAG: class I SAM-dependent methyltransferase [Bacteroidetes bacterium]|nr:class I SAM-dependent methyltransferase [Bacteroidota bacterium]